MSSEIKQIIINSLGLCTQHKKLSALFLGMLLALALPPYYHFWAVFVSLSYALFLIAKIDSFKTLAAIGYWYGFGFFALGFYWIGNALLVDMAATGWLYPFVLVLNGAFFGLFTILPFIATKLSPRVPLKILLFASVWCLVTEWMRSVIFTGFPWNPLSSALAFSPEMLQTLSIWGTYGLSLVLIIVAALPACWLCNRRLKHTLWFVLSFVLMVLLGLYGDYVLHAREQVDEGKSIIVRLVQPSIPQSVKWTPELQETNFNEYIKLSKVEDNQYVDFTIWGETAIPFDLYYDAEHVAKIRRAVPPNGYLITGFLRYADGRYYQLYNSFGVINKKGIVEGIYDKSHLVPFGEYIPFRKYLPKWVRPLTNTVAEFGRGIQYETIKIDDYPEFAPLICYEIIFSSQVIRKTDKPKWIIVLTNDGWYGNSSGPYQHLVAAQMRAVEEGVSVVRSANSGISAVINPYGEVVEQIPLKMKGVIDVAVKLDEAHDTWFGKLGNIIPLCISVLLLLFVILSEKIIAYLIHRKS